MLTSNIANDIAAACRDKGRDPISILIHGTLSHEDRAITGLHSHQDGASSVWEYWSKGAFAP